MIEIYPSTLPGQPIEKHDVTGITLHDWLTDKVEGYDLSETQPISATVNGEVIPPLEWPQLFIDDGTVVELRIQPGKFAANAISKAFSVITGLFSFLMPKQPKIGQRGKSEQGAQLAGAEIDANQPKLGEVIPDIAGRHRRYPDYLNQPRKYFIDNTTQAVDVMLCITKGRCAIAKQQMLVGKTPVEALGDNFAYEIFSPGESVVGNQSHRNWYSAPEVGASTGSAGLRLTAGTKGTRFAEASLFAINGNSITIPPSAGVAPDDWEVGGIVIINEKTRTLNISGGGNDRSIVSGDFSDLDLAVGSIFQISGLPRTDGVYQVHSYQDSVNVEGTASTITGVKAPSLEYLASPITFKVGVSTVTLEDDYPDVDELAAEINSQVAGAVISYAKNAITITEQYPYSGSPIAISGYFDPLLGANPTRVTGTKTDSRSEMTLDLMMLRRFGSSNVQFWTPAPAVLLPAGTHTNISIAKGDIDDPRGPLRLWSNQFRIESLIMSSSDVIGWEFQRLAQNGSIDSTWQGFHSEINTPDITMEYDQSAVVGGWLGPFLACPEGEVTDHIEWDVFCPAGLGYVKDNGSIEARTRTVELQYREYGTGAWQSVKREITGQSRDQLGWTFSEQLPKAMTVEVRHRRLGAEDTDTSAMDRIEWYGLKSLLPTVTSYPGVTTMGVTLIGSDTIAERTENQISVVPTRILPIRENGEWVGEQATREIAPWVCHIAKSIGYTDAEIDYEELDRLDAIWRTRGDKYDFIHNKALPVRDAINQALGAGFAEMTVDKGRIRAVRDEPRTDWEHMYTPDNMSQPLKRAFSMCRPDDSDGVDVEYMDPTTWTKKIVECRLPGDLGFKVDKITVDGVLDRTKAWRIGMRYRRDQRYIRWKYSFATEMDALNSRYLSYCALADDMPGYGQSAWLKDIVEINNDTALLLVSEPLEWTEGESHVLAWRKPNGKLAGPYPAERVDDEYSVKVIMPKPWPNPNAKQEPPHILFGTSERWSYPSLIRKINPNGLASVSVEAENYDARKYADDDNFPQ